LKILFIILGSLSLGLGFIGIFLPILPTTPFFLLAAYSYLKSSKRLYNWLINHRVFGSYINNYINHRAIVKSAKISALIFLWLSLLMAILFSNSTHLKLLLFFIGICVSIHILSLKTLKKEDLE
jgi:uncharacterized membrane protein YbaN (DUF454 family)